MVSVAIPISISVPVPVSVSVSCPVPILAFRLLPTEDCTPIVLHGNQ
jgi:hypothetical protein